MPPQSRRLEHSARPPLVRRPKARAVLFPLGVFLLGIVAWYVVVEYGIVNEIIVPAPGDVWQALIDLLDERFFWMSVQATLTETVYGFALGAGIGLALGAIIGSFTSARQMLYPLVIVFQNTPRIALAPIFLTWFGFGLASKVVMAAAIAFFPIAINTIVGLGAVSRDEELFMRSLGATRIQTFQHLTLPTAAPYVAAGLKTAMTLALLGAIVAEFVGATRGLGVLIQQFNFELNVDYGFAVLVFLAVAGLALYGIVELIDRKVIFWRTRDE